MRIHRFIEPFFLKRNYVPDPAFLRSFLLHFRDKKRGLAGSWDDERSMPAVLREIEEIGVSFHSQAGKKRGIDALVRKIRLEFPEPHGIGRFVLFYIFFCLFLGFVYLPHCLMVFASLTTFWRAVSSLAFGNFSCKKAMRAVHWNDTGIKSLKYPHSNYFP